MKKNPWRFVFLAMAVLSGSWLAFYGAVMLWAKHLTSGEAASIGVIGGADGPTAVFVTTSGPDWDIVIAIGALVIGLAGYWLLKRRNEKKR